MAGRVPRRSPNYGNFGRSEQVRSLDMLAAIAKFEGNVMKFGYRSRNNIQHMVTMIAGYKPREVILEFIGKLEAKHIDKKFHKSLSVARHHSYVAEAIWHDPRVAETRRRHGRSLHRDAPTSPPVRLPRPA